MGYSIPMASVRQRNDPVKLFSRRLLIIVLLILVLFALRAVWGVYNKEQESGHMRYQAESQLQDLKAREATLSANIDSLETVRGKEEALRGAYQVGKPGEGLIEIVDTAPTSTPEPPPSRFHWLRSLFPWW